MVLFQRLHPIRKHPLPHKPFSHPRPIKSPSCCWSELASGNHSSGCSQPHDIMRVRLPSPAPSEKGSVKTIDTKDDATRSEQLTNFGFISSESKSKKGVRP